VFNKLGSLIFLPNVTTCRKNILSARKVQCENFVFAEFGRYIRAEMNFREKGHLRFNTGPKKE
jgi:hypothetical protein